MPIPTYQAIMRPLLEVCEDGHQHRLRDLITTLGSVFELSEEELAAQLPSGFQAVFTNRVAWACTYLHKARLLDRVGRGTYVITARGREFVKAAPAVITPNDLSAFPEFVEFRGGNQGVTAGKEPPGTQSELETPEEMIERAAATLRSSLAGELLDRVQGTTPAFFEQLVVDVLIAMGYGGSRADAGRAVGRSGDGGIDGVINEDRLGLDAVYVQAKRWEHAVGRPEVQMFAGSLDGVRATKGVLITTSTFTEGARTYAGSIGKRIVLIDGRRLAELMIDHDVGVSTIARHELKRVEEAYFESS
jgi:restriction system protein